MLVAVVHCNFEGWEGLGLSLGLCRLSSAGNFSRSGDEESEAAVGVSDEDRKRKFSLLRLKRSSRLTGMKWPLVYKLSALIGSCVFPVPLRLQPRLRSRSRQNSETCEAKTPLGWSKSVAAEQESVCQSYTRTEKCQSIFSNHFSSSRVSFIRGVLVHV